MAFQNRYEIEVIYGLRKVEIMDIISGSSEDRYSLNIVIPKAFEKIHIYYRDHSLSLYPLKPC